MDTTACLQSCDEKGVDTAAGGSAECNVRSTSLNTTQERSVSTGTFENAGVSIPCCFLTDEKFDVVDSESDLTLDLTDVSIA